MDQKAIVLCYRKLINVNSKLPWEQMVFEDSYREFIMQFSYYNRDNRFNTFSELIHNLPSAHKLHFLVSGSIIGYLKQLNGRIPDLINSIGMHFLTFTEFQFEVINSDIRDLAKHQIAINFYSEPMTWHETIGNSLLLSKKGEVSEVSKTNLFALPPYVNIHSIQYL